MPVSNMPLMCYLQLGNGQVRVVSEDGQPIDIAPETIVVRQDGQVLLSGDGNSIVPGNQFVIQYYNPEEVVRRTCSFLCPIILLFKVLDMSV